MAGCSRLKLSSYSATLFNALKAPVPSRASHTPNSGTRDTLPRFLYTTVRDAGRSVPRVTTGRSPTYEFAVSGTMGVSTCRIRITTFVGIDVDASVDVDVGVDVDVDGEGSKHATAQPVPIVSPSSLPSTQSRSSDLCRVRALCAMTTPPWWVGQRKMYAPHPGSRPICGASA